MENFKQIAETALLAGSFELAISNYCKHLEASPKDIEVFNNIGVLYLNNREMNKALEYLYKSAIYSDREEYKVNFLQAIKKYDSIELKPEYLDLTASLLRSNLVCPIDVAIQIYNSVAPLFSIEKIKYKNNKSNYLIENLKDISNVQAFLILLRTTHIPSIEFETQINNIMETIVSLLLTDKEDILIFVKLVESLSIQSNIKEYIHIFDDDKYFIKKDLYSKFLSEENISKKYIIANLILFYKYDNQLVEFIVENSTDNEVVNYWKQKGELIYEDGFNGIFNESSLNIKNQYEINPYPQWIHTYIPPSKQDFAFCYNKNGLNPPIFNNHIEILIAGCGTGQHAIQTASSFVNSKVTAIDLSAASLSYAKRKTNEFNIKNIEFINSDILEFNSPDKKFDLIESVGVLHHMKKPIDGFNSLRKNLSDAGLMKIGLYSKKARKSIYEIQNNLCLQKEIKDQDKLINERKRIIDYINDTGTCREILLFSDFYNLSEFKDLFFNECEHSFDLKEIIELLKKTQLNFIGLDINENTLKLSGFKGSKPRSNDFEAWSEIEEKYPLIFSSMYIFWCNKA
jgi:2-polyprenyl-3-methyl-5-hydroxy-6-metoxy-1,4-benzoquinol methylase